MKKIIAAFLIISAGLLVSCKPVSVSDDGNEMLNEPDSRIVPRLPPSKSGQFLAARQALFNRTMLRQVFILTKLCPKVTVLLEQRFLSNYQGGNLKRAAEIAASRPIG